MEEAAAGVKAAAAAATVMEAAAVVVAKAAMASSVFQPKAQGQAQAQLRVVQKCCWSHSDS